MAARSRFFFAVFEPEASEDGEEDNASVGAAELEQLLTLRVSPLPLLELLPELELLPTLRVPLRERRLPLPSEEVLELHQLLPVPGFRVGGLGLGFGV